MLPFDTCLVRPACAANDGATILEQMEVENQVVAGRVAAGGASSRGAGAPASCCMGHCRAAVCHGTPRAMNRRSSLD